eukprot:g3591.t1
MSRRLGGFFCPPGFLRSNSSRFCHFVSFRVGVTLFLGADADEADEEEEDEEDGDEEYEDEEDEDEEDEDEEDEDEEDEDEEDEDEDDEDEDDEHEDDEDEEDEDEEDEDEEDEDEEDEDEEYEDEEDEDEDDEDASASTGSGVLFCPYQLGLYIPENSCEGILETGRNSCSVRALCGMLAYGQVSYQSLLALDRSREERQYLHLEGCLKFPKQTTLYKSERAARQAQPRDFKTYEPTEVVMVGRGKWINSCVALRDGCLSQMANIPDKPGGAYNARLRWDRKNCALSLWSTKTIYCEELRVSSYGQVSGQAGDVGDSTVYMSSKLLSRQHNDKPRQSHAKRQAVESKLQAKTEVGTQTDLDLLGLQADPELSLQADPDLSLQDAAYRTSTLRCSWTGVSEQVVGAELKPLFAGGLLREATVGFVDILNLLIVDAGGTDRVLKTWTAYDKAMNRAARRATSKYIVCPQECRTGCMPFQDGAQRFCSGCGCKMGLKTESDRAAYTLRHVDLAIQLEAIFRHPDVRPFVEWTEGQGGTALVVPTDWRKSPAWEKHVQDPHTIVLGFYLDGINAWRGIKETILIPSLSRS